MKHVVKTVLCALVLIALSICPARAQDELVQVRLMAHRGLTGNLPENSLVAVQAVMELGVDGCEVDVRTTADGQIILMHDASLERTTTGAGAVRDKRREELRRLKLKDGGGAPTSHPIPDLSEILDLLQTRPQFYVTLDLKQADVAAVAEQVVRRKLEERIYFFIERPQDVDRARAVKAADPRLKILVDLLNWWKIEELPTFVIHALDADAVFASEWFFPRFGFAEARAAGAQVQVFLYDGEALVERARRAVQLGAQVISCDRPERLLPFFSSLRQKAE